MAPALFLRSLVPVPVRVPRPPRDMENNRPACEETPLLTKGPVDTKRPSYTFTITTPPRNRSRVVETLLLFALLLSIFTPAYLYIFRSTKGCPAVNSLSPFPPPPPLLYSHSTEYEIPFAPLHVTDASLDASHFHGKSIHGRIIILPPTVSTGRSNYNILGTFVRTSATDAVNPRRVIPQIVTRGDSTRWLDIRSHARPRLEVVESTLSPNPNFGFRNKEYIGTCPAACCGSGRISAEACADAAANEVYIDVYLRPSEGYDGAIHIHATTLQVEMAPCARGQLRRGKDDVEWVWTLTSERQSIGPAATMK
ncbi:hypothetical protein TWF696_006950 [Orbilia brochopaga]|uniref:Uncharacterized protein n=1 Tax=Orbilia brochopaga TaxID=3140254 RepID=A0AAV9URV4_9PEZI